MQLRDRETERLGQVERGEEGIVAARGLRPAFEHVPGHDRTRQGVEIVSLPAEMGGGRPDDQRRVGDAAGNDDIGARPQALGDAPGAQVGVGRLN